MKKFLFSLAAMIAMVATSCVTDATNDLSVGGKESVVTFSVESQNVSRATTTIADGKKATRLQYAVYDAAGNHLSALGGEVTDFNGRRTINLTLLNQNNYTIVFWADAENGIYTFDATNKEVTANYTGVNANDDTLDAFYAVVPVEVNGSTVVTATLTRPFAQVNFATNDVKAAEDAGFKIDSLKSTFKATVPTKLNLLDGTLGEELTEVEFASNNLPGETLNGKETYTWVAMNYVFASKNGGSLNTCELTITDGNKEVSISYPNAPVKRNWRTNLIGALLTNSTKVEVEVDNEFDGTENIEIKTVGSAQGLQDAIEELNNSAAGSEGETVTIQLTDDINLNDLFAGLLSRAGENDPSLTIKKGKELTLDLGGKKLSATSSQTGKNYNMFDVQGTLTVINGTIEYKHLGENMGWGASTNIFNVTAGGILNLEGVTAKNLGGSDMGFVAHLNNWGEVTLNAENCTLESNYVAVRVFNSGYDMNNVTIKNSTLKGVSAAFWVHNYTVEDFGTEAKAEAQKALLNLNIYNQGNTFSPDVNGIRYGFTNSVRTDARGITKVVSEDGTEVTLGYFFDDNNGLIRRGVAGAEENTTIKKVIVEEGIATLYDRTFRRFYALEEVVLPSTLTTIGAAGSGVFQSCTNLKTVVIPESVTVLGKGSFQECSSLESINIPAGVTRIEADALRATGLVAVEFHEGVTYFGTQAFRDCKKLTKVVIKAPEFTMEGNTFGIMAAPFTPLTIEVANDEMKAYVESKLTDHAKTYITVVAPEVIDNTAALQTALAEGKNVDLANNLTITPAEMITAPYGNKMALSQKGGVFNGNGKAISVTANGDNYVVMTNGGTIKNLDIDRGFRGIVLMYPNQDIHAM